MNCDMSMKPALEPLKNAKFSLKGEIGRRLEALAEQWLIPAPAANPAMLAMFRDRDKKPYRNMVPWAGEFAGKHLVSAVQVLRLSGDPKLKKSLELFVEELLRCQDSDGYLGCWPKEERLKNKGTWDTWSHYHIMLGLLLWEELSGDARALSAAARIADLICAVYLREGGPRLADAGSVEMNMAPVHSLCLLYKRLGDPKHLAMAKRILEEFSAKRGDGTPLAGDYLEAPLSGKEFHETPKPRWESLHPIMGLAELHYITGDERCKEAFETLWRSMLRGDRHNNGGFSSGEKATGDPYDKGAIETCCTVAWMAMSVEMLRLSGLSTVADELELSLFNSGLGLMSPSGRWVTYDTPMDGTREASAHKIVFQARAGSPELNCCSVNGPRALGLLCDWALMRREDGLALNYYGPGEISATLPSGAAISIAQTTDYPRSSSTELSISLSKPELFTLALRIPSWSAVAKVVVDGEPQAGAKAGSYFEIRRIWKEKSVVRLEFDFSLQFWRHPRSSLLDRSNKKDWEATWTVIGPVPNAGKDPSGLNPESLKLDKASSMDEVLRAGGSVREKSPQGRIEFDEIFRNAPLHSAAYCFLEFDAPSEGELSVEIGCDWWFACFVNGKLIKAKANEGVIDMRCETIELQLKAGRNLIGFRITGGSAGWRISLGKGSFLSKEGQREEKRTVFASIYRGPLLLSYDARFNASDSTLATPALAKPELKRLDGWDAVRSNQPWLLMEGVAPDGSPVRYCDFASAGAEGNFYRSWTPLAFECPETEFSMENPRRSSPVSTMP